MFYCFNSLVKLYRNDCFDEDTRLRRCTEDFKSCLEQLNSIVDSTIQQHLQAAVDNTLANIRYFRLDSNGPHIKDVSLKNPLVPR